MHRHQEGGGGHQVSVARNEEEYHGQRTEIASSTLTNIGHSVIMLGGFFVLSQQ
jgi:hypothetical protein